MKYKAILFDLDGTCLDTDLYIVLNYIHLFKKYRPDYTMDLKELLSFSGPPLTDVFPKYFPNQKFEELYNEFISFGENNSKKYSKIYSDELSVLKFFKEAGLKLGIITSKKSYATDKCLTEFDLKKYFDVVITLDDVKNPKPDSEGLVKAVNELGLKVEDCLYVGDADTDSFAAQNCNMDFALAYWGLKKFVKLPPSKYILSGFKDLKAIIEKENKMESNVKKRIEDCIIVGMGPAGITAAIYLSRLNIKPLTIDENKIAHKLYQTPLISNYPGFDGKGEDLAKLFAKHVEQNKIRVFNSRVSTITSDGTCFKVQCEDDIFYSKTVLVSVGIRANPLIIPGAASFNFRGISRCAICDGPLFRGKDVAVYGDKTTSVNEALYLSEIVNKLYFICPSKNITADEALIKELTERENVEMFYDYKIVKASGAKSIETLEIKGNSKQHTFSVKGLFLYVGEANNVAFLPFPDIFNQRNFIVVNNDKMTKIPGLFAAGDITETPLRQIITACGDGAVAAISIKNYLKSNRYL